MHAHQFWLVWPFGFRRYGYPSNTANFPFWTINCYAFSAIAQLIPIPCIPSLIAVRAVSVLVFVLLSIKPSPSRMRSRSARPLSTCSHTRKMLDRRKGPLTLSLFLSLGQRRWSSPVKKKEAIDVVKSFVGAGDVLEG